MNSRFALQARLVFIAAGAFGTTAAQTRGATIGVQAGQYVLAGGAIDDLDALETELRAAGATAVRFDVCDDDATRALLGAMHRFSDLPLSLRYVDTSSPGCAVTKLARRAGLRSGRKPYGIDDAEVKRYLQRVSP